MLFFCALRDGACSTCWHAAAACAHEQPQGEELPRDTERRVKLLQELASTKEEGDAARAETAVYLNIIFDICYLDMQILSIII